MKHEETIRNFYHEVFNQHQAQAAARYMRSDYIQHNPGVGQGRDAFIDAFKEKFKKVPNFHLEIKRIIVQDNLAAVHLRASGLPDGSESAVCDIYRFDEDGLLAEHWDVLMPIPASVENKDLLF